MNRSNKINIVSLLFLVVILGVAYFFYSSIMQSRSEECIAKELKTVLPRYEKDTDAAREDAVNKVVNECDRKYFLFL